MKVVNVIVVDTSSWISYFKGHSLEDLDLGLKEGRVLLSPVVIAELMSAPLNPTERKDLISFLRELPLCSCDVEHWIRVGEFRSAAQRKGLTISTPDAHVAQCSMDVEGYLLSEDLIFKKASKFFPLKLI